MRFARTPGRPLVIGHRGAAALAPENTLESLAAGVAAGSDAIEFDVGDDLLLGHSPGERPANPSSLDDALAFLGERDVGVHIDVKVEGIELAVARAVRRHDLVDRTLVSSTSVRTLRRFGATAPELLRAISYPRDRLGVGQVAWPGRVTAGGAASLRAAMPVGVRLLLGSSRASAVSLHKSLVTPAVVRAARGRGAIVLAWTANDAAQIERLAIAGVDAIVSDDPARALEVLATLNPL